MFSAEMDAARWNPLASLAIHGNPCCSALVAISLNPNSVLSDSSLSNPITVSANSAPMAANDSPGEFSRIVSRTVRARSNSPARMAARA